MSGAGSVECGWIVARAGPGWQPAHRLATPPPHLRAAPDAFTFEAWLSSADYCTPSALLSYALPSSAADPHQATADFNHLVRRGSGCRAAAREEAGSAPLPAALLPAAGRLAGSCLLPAACRLPEPTACAAWPCMQVVFDPTQVVLCHDFEFM